MSFPIEIRCLKSQYSRHLNRPSKSHLGIREYVHPEVFLEIEEEAKAMGFLHVASGPFVRSSFNAAEAFGLIGDREHGERT